MRLSEMIFDITNWFAQNGFAKGIERNKNDCRSRHNVHSLTDLFKRDKTVSTE